MYACPKDKKKLIKRSNTLVCEKCGTIYPIEDGVPIFSENRGYWSNVNQETMRTVIRRSEETGDWRRVLDEEIPQCERHIAPLFRGDIHNIFPIDSESVILDAGSMWGGVTLPVAQHCKEIHAIDKTWESLRYLAVRAEQDGLENVFVAESGIASLPYADHSFDHVILNGVLEWLAMDEDIVLDHDWTEKKVDALSYSEKSNPEQVQLEGLKELYRVTKQDGSIYIAIENRIGLQYYLGHPDDHVNIRFVSFLPRALANYITRKVKNHDYRTYLYSPNKLRELVIQAGFAEVELYSSYPHYNIISRLVPFKVFDKLKALSYDGSAPLNATGKLKVALFSLAWRFIPNPFRKHMCPSISLVATKEKRPVARIVTALHKAEIIHHQNYTAILANNRFADQVPANMVLWNNQTDSIELFCKVSRIKNTEGMKIESNILNTVNASLSGSTISGTVPELVFWGILDGIEMQVTKYVQLKPTDSPLLSGLIKALSMTGKDRLRNLSLWLRSRWFRRHDASMKKAILWLTKFQESTSIDSFNDAVTLVSRLKERTVKLDESKIAQIDPVLTALSMVETGTIALSTEHGDFDTCNLFELANGQLFVVDFEHAVENSLPFFDLGNLLFSTLIQDWRRNGNGASIADFSDSLGVTHSLAKWIKEYSALTGVSLEVLQYLPALAVIEQHCKTFPESRDPADYPMYGDDTFGQMLEWRLKLRN
jgi:SAM-dependent methyltransferase